VKSELAKKNQIISNKNVLSAVIIVIALLDLLILYFFKYKNQGLDISDFNLLYVGNALDFVFTLILIIGIILYSFFKKQAFKSSFLIFFTVILNLVLALAIISTIIRLPLPNIYFLDHPLSIIFIGALFSLYQFIQFIFLSILWYSVIGKELVILRAVVSSVVLVVLLLFITFFYINIKKNGMKEVKPNTNSNNVAVVLGAAVWSHNSPSPSLAARVDKALELYNKGIVNRIQLTGSNAPGEMSESEVAYNYLKSITFRMPKIWLEHKTVSTSEQVRFIKDSLMTKKNIGHVIIVSDAYHLTRVGEICKFYKIKAGFAASNLKLSLENNLYYKVKESIALLVFWLFAL